MSKYVVKSALVAVAVALLLPLSAGAQTSKTSHFTQSNSLEKHDIVKEYIYPATIASAVTEDGSTQFYYNASGQNVLKATLQGYQVYDFVIDNDTVFFCGKKDGNTAMIGFFNIHDMFQYSGYFFVADYFQTSYIFQAADLKKIITYRDSTHKRHIVCVGKSYFSDGYYDSYRACIVDLFSESTGAYLSFNVGIINDDNLSSSMLDIKRFCTAVYPRIDDTTRPYLPCDYLVVAGVDTNRHLSVRFFDSQNPFSTTGPQNTLYVFDQYPQDCDGFISDFYNSMSQYVLFGHCRNNDIQHNYEVETSGSASHCQPQTTATLNPQEPPESHGYNSTVDARSGRNSFKTLRPLSETFSIVNDCED